MYKNKFIEIDGYITEGLRLARESFNKGAKRKSSLTRAYAELVTFNLKVAEIARAYNHDIGIMEKIGMLVTAGTDSSDLQICVSQTVGRSLSFKKATFVLLQIYNTKIRAFRGIFLVQAQGVRSFDVFETQRILLRNKRYFWPEGLAAV